jgi:hypothetical protein
MKILGITSHTIVIGFFILYTGNQYKDLTGMWQYSPFAGWQLANNAMYIYRYVDSTNRKPLPKQFQKLDNTIRAYYDSTRDTRKFPVEGELASTAYMWSRGLPLYHYQDNIFKNDLKASELKKWASMGPLYKDYGFFIISQYPSHFAQYFLWPNTQKYYAPPVEYLETYNKGIDTVDLISKIWFQYKSQRITTRTKDMKVEILNFYPIFSGIINMVMLFGLFSYVLIGGMKQTSQFRKGMLLSGLFWLLNAGFTIFAYSVALRFQTFPIMLTTMFVGLIVDYLIKMSNIKLDVIELSSDTIKLSEPLR